MLTRHGAFTKDNFAGWAFLRFIPCMRVLIIGCGYVGLPLGVELKNAGHEVFGLRRNPSASAELRDVGVIPVVADITEPEGLLHLPGSLDWVVNCTSAGGGGSESYRRVYVDGMRNLVSKLMGTPASGFSEGRRREGSAPRFVYTSSTGVYGQNDGSWVTEESPTEPLAETGRILVEAEQVLLSAHRDAGFPALVLRLAGIYGPGRGYWFKQFLSGEAGLEGDGSRFLNMVHRDDVVGAIVAALARGKPGEVYNVVDNEPVTQRDLFRWLSDVLHKPMPPSVPPRHSPRRRRPGNKRISNAKLRQQLGYRLRFPTFRDGFAALAKG